ncbi:MAG: 16S rRNA (guanine(527)-N(7))-methyltransferase RsmG [Pseudomonadota bacterium]
MTTSDTQLLNRLTAGLAQLEVPLAAREAQRLVVLVQLLARWNKAYNLTAIKEPVEMIDKHVLDSLSLHRYVTSGPVLDVGTGGGFPGLPLALCSPELAFTLLDSHAKKLRFVNQAAAAMALGNVTTMHSRVEHFDAPAGFATITSRAFASLRQIADWCGHLLAPGGKLLAMKGHVAEQELAELGAGWHAKAEPVVVPFVDGVRHIVTLTPA